MARDSNITFKHLGDFRWVLPGRKAQITVGVLLSMSIVGFLLLGAIWLRVREEMNSLKRMHDNESALFAAEGAIEEALLRIREGVNDPVDDFFGWFRSEQVSRLSIKLPETEKYLGSVFGGGLNHLSVELSRLDMERLKDDFIAQSPDRCGHIALSASARIGDGKAGVRVVVQFRLLDIGIPQPLCKYDIAFRLDSSIFAINKTETGEMDICRLPAGELKIIYKQWKSSILTGGKEAELTGSPFVRTRVCYFFPTWKQMHEFLSWEGRDIHIYGDILSPDTEPLILSNRTVFGFGRVFSQKSPILIDHSRFDSRSAVTFGILDKGDVCLRGMPNPDESRFALFLPNGRFRVEKGSRFKGFAFVKEADSQDDAEGFIPDPQLKEQRTMVVISSQTLTWESRTD